MDKGQLIPDELIISILADVLDANREAASEGVIFDEPEDFMPFPLQCDGQRFPRSRAKTVFDEKNFGHNNS